MEAQEVGNRVSAVHKSTSKKTTKSKCLPNKDYTEWEHKQPHFYKEHNVELPKGGASFTPEFLWGITADNTAVNRRKLLQ